MTHATLNAVGESRPNRLAGALQRHWPALLIILVGLYVVTPFFAPILMQLSATGIARAIYAFYSTQCHQLPERSYFLFGEQLTYSIGEIDAAMNGFGANAFVRRAFIGNDTMGYKLAYSDRMVWLYSSFWLGAIVFAALRGRMRALPIWLLVVALVPLLLDGGSHTVSDLQGVDGGFRAANDWLRGLTSNSLGDSVYIGDGWASFNSLMRLITGVLAGAAVAWAILPRIDKWLFRQ
jgi:uncharacterized membrane protein